jgi:hypothetical protein
VIGCPPVRFRRSPGMLPLPLPERGGSIAALRSNLNLSNHEDFVLVVAWLLAALRPRGPYPLLAISGEQGSAKTVLWPSLSSRSAQTSLDHGLHVPAGHSAVCMGFLDFFPGIRDCEFARICAVISITSKNSRDFPCVFNAPHVRPTPPPNQGRFRHGLLARLDLQRSLLTPILR